MLGNYLKIAQRNLVRHKAFSFINILGLTIGLTCCFLIMVFVRHETSYDTFHAKHDRIYRLNYMPKFAGYSIYIGLTPAVASPLLPDYFSDIEKSARVYRSNATIEVKNAQSPRPVKFDEDHFFFADSSLIDIFSFQFIEGDPKTALKQAYSLVITDEIARKYFGNAPALGKTVTYEGKHPLTVTGVVKAFPDNSHIRIDLLSDYQTMFATESELVRSNLPQNWVITHSATYVLLRPGKTAEAVNARLPKFLATHADPQIAKDIEYRLQPLTDIHLNADVESNPEPTGSMTYVYVFLGIGIMTLLIACINFINLSTARSLQRAREVGIRKTLGSEKGQIVLQFLGESLLLSGIALVFAVMLITLLFPVLNALTNKNLTWEYLLANPALLIVFALVAIVAGLISGSYPAFFVARFQPIATLKGSFVSGKAKGGAVRQVLLGFQFIASIVLIIGAMVAFRQLRFLMEQPMGFNKDFIITADIRNDKITNVFAARNDSAYLRLKTFREALAQHPGVEAVTFATQRMGTGAVRRNVVPEGKTQEANLFIGTIGIDFNFVKTYGLQLAAGRELSEQYSTDKSAGFLINETGVKMLGWKSNAEALNKNINLEGKQGRIVGILKDFHGQSLQNPIEGMVFHIEQPLFTQVSMKLSTAGVDKTLAFIGREWDKYFPEKGFDYQFLDQSIADAYAGEQRLSKLITYFAGLAVLISCLGLYGLVSIVTQQRTKEIGIRKVLGASVRSIVQLLSRDFVVLVGISLVIASPLAWYAMDKWLENFAFKTNIAWWIFGLAGIVTVAVTLLTVSFQSIKAALTNPVKSLKTD
ncbi:ABC transporter permease [Dyadobacter beijingensis]|uniref:ABC transporter permease n=1 Tax=Dyadobacter beijingensis TaxID=365489 RepID=A0ABQ2HF02_9BACT|nr:ABC transporter permease [Dyadobacter beijingensis]GGM79431.1 ABC transporter permease [Dyadobacter beijingensis]